MSAFLCLVSTARPKTRGECANGPRPCPYVTCRYSLFLDQEPKGRRLKVIQEADSLDLDRITDQMLEEWMDGRPTCALDIAEDPDVTKLEREELEAVIMDAMSMDENEMKNVMASARKVVREISEEVL